MKKRKLTLSEIALIASTRGMLGAGIGLLLSSKLNKDHLVPHRFVLLSVCSLLAGAMLACAAKGGVDGKWIAQLPAREGQTRETTFNFKSEGKKLTGTVSGRGGDNPISDGQVNGDEISFTVTASFRDNEVKLLYKGKVTGNEIHFTRTREGGDQPPQEFTARRA